MNTETVADGGAEEVVLLNDTGAAIGTAPKATVHTDQTPLHLAFSCYLVNDHGDVLVTRRALSKVTWPGVWTNSFCGHPGPGEEMAAAIRRRAEQELGTTVGEPVVALPGFRYRATDASGIVEHEICPVHVARITGSLNPNPDEVAEWAWVTPQELATAVAGTPFAFSPWLVEQLPQILPQLGLETHDPRTGSGR